MDDCIFCKIIAKDIPAKLVHEGNEIIAFDDLHPKAPIHKLIIPRKHIATTNDISLSDMYLVGEMFKVAQLLAAEHKIDKSGYRLVMNCNKQAGQEVYHIHLHLLGGKQMSWPPGT